MGYKIYETIISETVTNVHGILWSAGDVDYREVSNIINEKLGGDLEYIYVKGAEKKKWLSDILKSQPATIINLDDLDCPSDEKLYNLPTLRHMNCHTECINYICAAENVNRYKHWFARAFTFRPSLRKSIMLYSIVENLADLSAKDIALIPIMAIIKFSAHEIDKVWEKLSENQKQNPHVSGLRRCNKHSIDCGDGDIAGCFFYSLIKDCEKCAAEESSTKMIM